MAGKVLNINISSPLKLRIDLTGKDHEIYHYSYNLPLAIIVERSSKTTTNNKIDMTIPKDQKNN